MTKTILKRRMSWSEKLYKRSIKVCNGAGRGLGLGTEQQSKPGLAHHNLCRDQMQQLPHP